MKSSAIRPDSHFRSNIDRILSTYVRKGMPAKKSAVWVSVPGGSQMAVIPQRTRKVAGVNKALLTMTLLRRIK